MIAPEIFKAYDIRGIVGQSLNDNTADLIAQSIAAEAISSGITHIAIGRDGRLSGSHLTDILSQNLIEAGLNVLNLGAVTTPMLYFAAHHHASGSGVMITGSHNPPQYNGFKIMLAGETLSGSRIQDLHQRITQRRFSPPKVGGTMQHIDISDEYIKTITDDIKLKKPLHIVIDAGNGIAGAYAPRLFKALGCKVQSLFCEVDGNFPHHHPDPAKIDNLRDLITTLRQGNGQIGLAFDGDGDRLGVVTQNGNIIYPDRQLMLFAADILKRHPQAKVIFDVKCTRLLKQWIHHHNGIAMMSKTGHSFMKAAMKEHNAALAGEMSGHLFFKERWFGFDDGLYAGCRLLEILSNVDDITRTLESLPESFSTPEINIALEREGQAHEIITHMQNNAHFEGADEVITIDGLRVEYADGFGLIRASNTTPVLVLRFEGDNPKALARIREQFVDLLGQYDIQLPHSS